MMIYLLKKKSWPKNEKNSMSDLSFLSALLVGLGGGVHCVGMCGGVSLALSAATPAGSSPLPYALSYNFGRIFSYILAGAVTGGIGQIAKDAVPVTGPVLAVFSGIMLIAMACYLGNWWRGLTAVEALGSKLWQRIQPLSKRFLPFRSPISAFPYGMIWGWLPCGLVYSTLTWALASGTAISGAVIMAGFGLGTLPALLAVRAGADWLSSGFRQPVVRQIIALSLLFYALLLLWRALSTIH